MLLLAANHNQVCLLLKTSQVSFHSTSASNQSLITWLPYEEMRSWKKEEEKKVFKLQSCHILQIKA